MNRYYNSELLGVLQGYLEEIPSMYTVGYSGETKSIPFDKFKYALGIADTKTFSKCEKEISKLVADLGAETGKNVRVSKHSKWLWFNFDGTFEGYPEEVAKRRSEEYQDRLRKEKQILDQSINDGTYGINTKDKEGVYLISCGDFFKIGFSKNVQNRLSSIRSSNPMEVKLIHKYSYPPPPWKFYLSQNYPHLPDNTPPLSL